MNQNDKSGRNALAALIKPEQIRQMPHLDEAMKAKYEQGTRTMWALISSKDPGSLEYNVALEKLIEATQRIRQGYRGWLDGIHQQHQQHLQRIQHYPGEGLQRDSDEVGIDQSHEQSDLPAQFIRQTAPRLEEERVVSNEDYLTEFGCMDSMNVHDSGSNKRDLSEQVSDISFQGGANASTSSSGNGEGTYDRVTDELENRVIRDENGEAAEVREILEYNIAREEKFGIKICDRRSDEWKRANSSRQQESFSSVTSVDDSIIEGPEGQFTANWPLTREKSMRPFKGGDTSGPGDDSEMSSGIADSPSVANVSVPNNQMVQGSFIRPINQQSSERLGSGGDEERGHGCEQGQGLGLGLGRRGEGEHDNREGNGGIAVNKESENALASASATASTIISTSATRMATSVPNFIQSQLKTGISTSASALTIGTAKHQESNLTVMHSCDETKGDGIESTLDLTSSKGVTKLNDGVGIGMGTSLNMRNDNVKLSDGTSSKDNMMNFTEKGANEIDLEGGTGGGAGTNNSNDHDSFSTNLITTGGEAPESGHGTESGENLASEMFNETGLTSRIIHMKSSAISGASVDVGTINSGNVNSNTNINFNTNFNTISDSNIGTGSATHPDPDPSPRSKVVANPGVEIGMSRNTIQTNLSLTAHGGIGAEAGSIGTSTVSTTSTSSSGFVNANVYQTINASCVNTNTNAYTVNNGTTPANNGSIIVSNTMGIGVNTVTATGANGISPDSLASGSINASAVSNTNTGTTITSNRISSASSMSSVNTNLSSTHIPQPGSIPLSSIATNVATHVSGNFTAKSTQATFSTSGCVKTVSPAVSPVVSASGNTPNVNHTFKQPLQVENSDTLNVSTTSVSRKVSIPGEVNTSFGVSYTPVTTQVSQTRNLHAATVTTGTIVPNIANRHASLSHGHANVAPVTTTAMTMPVTGTTTATTAPVLGTPLVSRGAMGINQVKPQGNTPAVGVVCATGGVPSIGVKVPTTTITTGGITPGIVVTGVATAAAAAVGVNNLGNAATVSSNVPTASPPTSYILTSGGATSNSAGGIVNRAKLHALFAHLLAQPNMLIISGQKGNTGGGGDSLGDSSQAIRSLISAQVEQSVVDVAEEFVDAVLDRACKFAKLRQQANLTCGYTSINSPGESSTGYGSEGSKGGSPSEVNAVLELRDIQMVLERMYCLRIPGYASDEIRTVRRIHNTTILSASGNAINGAATGISGVAVPAGTATSSIGNAGAGVNANINANTMRGGSGLGMGGGNGITRGNSGTGGNNSGGSPV